MSTNNHHYQARQSYVEALKDLARRNAEREKASGAKRAETLERQVEERRREAAWKQATIENALRIANRTRT